MRLPGSPPAWCPAWCGPRAHRASTAASPSISLQSVANSGFQDRNVSSTLSNGVISRGPRCFGSWLMQLANRLNPCWSHWLTHRKASTSSFGALTCQAVSSIPQRSNISSLAITSSGLLATTSNLGQWPNAWEHQPRIGTNSGISHESERIRESQLHQLCFQR